MNQIGTKVMNEIISLLEEQLLKDGSLTLDREKAERLVRWLKALTISMKQQQQLINQLKLALNTEQAHNLEAKRLVKE
jgi:hypothetical protein